jgi:SH3 domain-containing YSC84-like protein 1
MKYAAGLAILSIAPMMYAVEPESGAQKRVTASAEVLSEILHAKDRGIPEDLIARAQCVGIVPSLKRVGFIVGAKYGKGEVVCRTARGWSAPSTIRIEGGSFGFQIGASATDLILLVKSERGAEKLLQSKFTLGAEASVAAGPVGRTATAQTDAQMHAEILSWSRSQGLFAGIALEGATLREDLDDNAALYGTKLENRYIVSSGTPPPESAAPLMALLNTYSWRER